MDLPLAQANTWSTGPGKHRVSQDGDKLFYRQRRATTGKAGVQAGPIAGEVEGPSVGTEVADEVGSTFVNYYAGAEASLFRVEARAGPACVRLEPNVNTCAGVQGGQLKLKLAGFGFTIKKGLAIHTPLGSLGFGKF